MSWHRDAPCQGDDERPGEGGDRELRRQSWPVGLTAKRVDYAPLVDREQSDVSAALRLGGGSVCECAIARRDVRSGREAVHVPCRG